jgi:hypothetical protein
MKKRYRPIYIHIYHYYYFNHKEGNEPFRLYRFSSFSMSFFGIAMAKREGSFDVDERR